MEVSRWGGGGFPKAPKGREGFCCRLLSAEGGGKGSQRPTALLFTPASRECGVPLGASEQKSPPRKWQRTGRKYRGTPAITIKLVGVRVLGCRGVFVGAVFEAADII